MLTQFKGQRFLALESYRRDGTAVRTPLLFIIHRGRLYMRTGAHTYKVKRIQNNPKVRVVPSTFKGKPMGVWVEGEARVFDSADMQWVDRLSKRRNGWFKWSVDLRNRFRNVTFVVIEMRLDHAATE
ncbi:MAG: PPOX class F420-dependent oxidoreductase [Candidatus Promineifilaceae bacterium]